MRGTVLVMVAVLLGSALGTVWYVHPDSAQNCIQDCLDSCATGDTVLVGPGTYLENIAWPSTQSIRLLSEHGRDTTIIDGDSAGSVIACTTAVDTTTVIGGLAITNGYAEAGGGIYCYRSSPRISDCAILNNRAIGRPGYGGGICCRRSSPTIIDAAIAGNVAGSVFPEMAGYGGGIACLDSSSPNVDRNTISSNMAGGLTGGGGGIYCVGNSPARIVRNTIASNSCATGGGGGILCDLSECVIDSNTIRENSLVGVGAGIAVAECSPTIANNLITLNVGHWLTVPSGGAGIAVSRSAARISKNTITLNQLLQGGHGAAVRIADATPTIDSCIISDNDGASGVYCTGGAMPEIHFNGITGNKGWAVLNADSTVVVNAEYNWWGDATGPFHPDSNPGGLGDTVSDFVYFKPWLDAPVGIVFVQREDVGRQAPPASIVRGVLRVEGRGQGPGDRPELLDISGRRVMGLGPGLNDIRHLAPGIYFVRRSVTEDGRLHAAARKVIVQD